MTNGGTTTTYTYDDWGRTISKSDGPHVATYDWRSLLATRCQASTPTRYQVALGNALAREVVLRASEARVLNRVPKGSSATAKTGNIPKCNLGTSGESRQGSTGNCYLLA